MRPASLRGRCLALLLVPALCFGASPAARAETPYRLDYGDALSVSVLGQPDLSVGDQPVRPDGRISLPMLPDVEVRGRSVSELKGQLEQAYGKLLAAPRVVVTLSRFRPLRITLLGQVSHPGTFSFEAPPTLLDALAASGGLTERADRGRIRVVPASGPGETYALDALLADRERAPRLAPGSVVEVGEVWGPDLYRILPIAASIVTAAALVLQFAPR